MENSAHGYSEGSEQEYEKPPGYDHYKLTIDLMLEKKELKKELASLKEENDRLKESIKELIPIVEFFTVSHLKEGEIWMNRDEVIERAKALLI